MNEPDPPDFERTLPARPSRPPKEEEAEAADHERTMPAHDPRSSHDPEIADLEKTVVPPSAMPPPVPPAIPSPPPQPPPVPPAIPSPPPQPVRGNFIPPASHAQQPAIPPSAPVSAPGKKNNIWIVTGCVGCGLLGLIVAIGALVAYFAWTSSSERGKVPLPLPEPVPERAAASPSEPPALHPKPGFIVGRALFADGRPIPLFRVSAIASDEGTNAFVRESAGANVAEVEGRDGRYELPAGKSPKAITLRAVARIAYRGRTYNMEMHPVQADVTVLSAVDLQGEGGQALVRDFVLKISGVRPGYDGRVVKETTSQDKPANAFYGGTIHLDLTYSEGTTYGAELARTPPEAKIAITLTPAGPLLDGSSARPIVREIRPAAGQPNFYFHLHNIPIGVYMASASRIDPNGTTTALRLSSAPRAYQPSGSVDFIPTRTARSVGVDAVTLYLVK